MNTALGTLWNLAGYIAAVALGAWLGSRPNIRTRPLPWLGRLQLAALMILIVSLGVKLGADDEVIASLAEIGWTAFVITAAAMAGSVLALWLLALICLLAYGSLMLWAGFRIDTGRDLPLAAVLHMPAGWLISGLCLAAGVFCGGVAAKEFAEAEMGWWRKGSIAILFVMLGAFVLINVF